MRVSLIASLTLFTGLASAPTLWASPCIWPQGQVAGEAPREVMWKAPTRADWAKPCLIEWQRNFEDALAVAEETGKPILICVNMDGEIASEHYAGIRYRTLETAELYKPYVTVIASTYRHTPRDYTPDGQRIECPRFGGVTCGEHVSIEPGLFEQYFEGQRVAPRHIMVEVDKKEVFDVFYAFDTKSVFDQIREGVKGREVKPVETDRGPRDWKDRLTSRDQADRSYVERAFVDADETKRVEMLQAALEAGDEASRELMRLALLGETKSMAMAGQTSARQLAWTAMVEDPTMERLPLMETALALDMDEVDRTNLVNALDTLGEKAPRAKHLASVQKGLMKAGDRLALKERVAQAQKTDLETVVKEHQKVKSELESRAKTWRETGVGDGSAQLQASEAFLARAMDAKPKAKETRLLFEDARMLAKQALEMGQSSWLAHGILGICEYRFGTLAASKDHVEKAITTMPVHAMGTVAVETLRMYAQEKRRTIRDSMGGDANWSPDMLADAQAAFGVLQHHPLCLEQDCITHMDFLTRAGAYPQAAKALDASLLRFPDSAELHLRLRNRILYTKGATGLGGLEATYEAMLAAPTATPNLTWFAGYASLLAAEYHRRAGEASAAVGAYDRSIAHFENNQRMLPDNAYTASHFIAIALVAKGRMAMEAGELSRAQGLVLDAFQRAPGSMGTIDGLGLTGVMTATTLSARLAENDLTTLGEELQSAIDGLQQEVRRAPAFDRVGPR